MMRVGTPTPMDGSHLTVAASSAPSSALRRSQRLLEAAASRRKLVARVLWGTVVFLCVLGCLSQVFIFLDIFWKFPTIIEIETERTDELDFPGITICNNNRFRVSAWCNTFGDATCDKSHVKMTAMDQSLAKMNRSVRIAMGHQRQTMIFETSKVVNGTIEVTDQQAFRDSFFHLKYSNCFAYNVEWTGSGVRDAERARQIDLQVILFLEQREYKEGTEWPGAQIVFHDAEVIPDPEESGIPLRAGHNYIFTLRQMVTKRLPWPYWTRCINYPFVRRGRYIMKMTKPLCEKECAYNASLTMCRCIRTDVALPYEVEWDREPSGRRRFCDSDIALTRCWVKVLDEMERCQKKHCRRACLETQFETSVTQDPWPDELFFKQESEKYAHINITSFQEARMNLTRIYVIYGTLNRITYRHRPKYEQIELFSYMGGFIGIWIGVSFLNVLDYGSRFVSWAIHRCKEGKRNSRATTPQRIDSPVDHKVKTLQVQKAPNGYHGEQTCSSCCCMHPATSTEGPPKPGRLVVGCHRVRVGDEVDMEEYSSSGSLHSSTSSGAWNPPPMLVKQETQANFGFYGHEASPLHHPTAAHQGHSLGPPADYIQQSPYFDGGLPGGHGWQGGGELSALPPTSMEDESAPRKRGRKKKLQTDARLPGVDPDRPLVRKRGRPRKYPPVDGCKGPSEMIEGVIVKQERITDVFKQRKKIDRFEGMPEEEVAKRTLPDHLVPNLDIVIIGINPGLFAAFKGHHYAGPGNHFWRCLFLAGLIPEPMTAVDDFKLVKYGIGFTNIVARTTRSSADLSRKEIKEGAEILLDKLKAFRPRIAVFNGKGIYEIFSGNKNFVFGRQPEPIEGTNVSVFVMPSSSARCAQLPRAVDKLPFYVALKKLRDHLRGLLPALHPSEVTFPDVKLRVEAKDEFDCGGEEPNSQDHVETGPSCYPQIKEEPGLASCTRPENGPTPRKRGRRKKSEMAAAASQPHVENQQHYYPQHHPDYNLQQQQPHDPETYGQPPSGHYYRNDYREEYRDDAYRGGREYEEGGYRDDYGTPAYTPGWSEGAHNYGADSAPAGSSVGSGPRQDCIVTDGRRGSEEARYGGGGSPSVEIAPGSDWAYPSTYEPSEDLSRTSDFPSWIKQEPLDACDTGGTY